MTLVFVSLPSPIRARAAVHPDRPALIEDGRSTAVHLAPVRAGVGAPVVTPDDAVPSGLFSTAPASLDALLRRHIGKAHKRELRVALRVALEV